ncbi:IclR family transcriptional regulator [Mesorhizobium sp. DCY119]|jgi:DNA-binding IclR family transcriptional regulator|uniref:IclR family transcriptional regulator n=1 Tax=Mesorhizobium sp. DCY119 TaxID=2108445 RepID=UPI000E71CF0F|nr:IclR family transcriptional regulator [Mesorhizobium sp. DCY119]RJG41033.1 IclR family transcriptional regulator [Mesorhizobium sp. DCY119]
MSGTVEKALKVLELLSTYDTPVRLAELSRELGMNKSTTYRMLETMSQHGFVQQDEPNGRYMITTKLWEIGVRAFQRLDIRAWGRPYLEQIGRELEETSVLAIIDDQEVVIIEKCASSRPVQTFSPLGSRSPMHCSSLGKAFLMVDTEEKLKRLRLPLQSFTTSTITTLPSLRAHIAKAVEEGVSVAFDEFNEGVSGAAAPVLGVDGTVHAVIGVTVPTTRAEGDAFRHVKEVIRLEAAKFSRALGYASPSPDSLP